MKITEKILAWFDLVCIIIVILAVTFFITTAFVGCSKDDEFLEPEIELLDTISTQVSELLPPSSQSVAVIYEFDEEYVIEGGVQYPNPTLCPISYNNVSMSGGIITITTDCSLTDGYFQAQVTDMKFETDEILVLGEGGVFSWPKTLEIVVCNDETITITHERPELNQVFFFVYKS